MEFGLSWPRLDADYIDWEPLIAAVESEPFDGPIHRARNPDSWFWYSNEFQIQADMANALRVANWQRSGGKQHQKPELITPPWSEEKKKLPGDRMDTDEFEKKLEAYLPA